MLRSERNRKALLRQGMFVAASIVVGAMVSLFRSTNPLRGACIGGVISVYAATAEDLLFARLRGLRVTAFWLVKTLCYTAVISFVLVAADIERVGSPPFIRLVLLALIITSAIAFLTQVNRMMGKSVLLHLFSGTYYRPVEEERVIMFLDLATSTGIAERLGNLRFHMLLNRCFFDLTEAVIESGGEIYKYLGDGVIVTWKPVRGLRDASCIKAFFDIASVFQNKSVAYLSAFGVVPQFRAGMHIGVVVIGELGDVKKEIAILGDTVNTAARIEAECAGYDSQLIISEEVRARLAALNGYHMEDLGSIQMRGKKQHVTLFAVTRRDNPDEALVESLPDKNTDTPKESLGSLVYT